MTTANDEFSLPANLGLPEELQGESPREIPESVNYGYLAKSKQRTFRGCILAGAICLIFSAVPFVDTLALYFLPLAYLSWIGLALCALGIGTSLVGGELTKAKAYIRDGYASWGRIHELIRTPSQIVNGQTAQWAYHAAVEVLHPTTGEPRYMQVKSRDFSDHAKNRIDTRFRVGDYVPVVWLPDRFNESLQIYDFLEVTEHTGLNRNVATGQSPLWQLMLLIITLPCLFFCLGWSIYAHGRFEPLAFDYLRDGAIPLAIGGGIGMFTMALGFWVSLKNRKKVQVHNQTAVDTGSAFEIHPASGWLKQIGYGLILTFGAVMLGGVTFLGFFLTANALLDESPAQATPVVISDMIQVTHSFIFREYKLEYQLQGDGKERSLLTTPDHLSQFLLPLGTAKVRAGYFNWPWVDTIEPTIRLPDVEAGGNQ